VGYNWGTVSQCYATGAVTGDWDVGGLLGANEGTVSECYATGAVTGNESVGGLLGANWGTVENSFWDTETSGIATSDGGTGLPTAQMQTLSTFTGAGWDFATVWGMLGSYPYLQALPQHTLTYSASAGGSISGATSQRVNVATTGSPVLATANAGYHFVRWSDGSTANPRTDANMTENLSVTAVFALDAATVTFDAQGGSAPNPASMTVVHGSAYGTLATTSRTGYTFGGWYTAASGGTQVTDSTIVTTASDHTLYAHWTGLTYTVTFDAQGGSAPNPGSMTVTYGSAYGTLATTSRSGYTFGGWYTAASGGAQVTASTIVTTAVDHTLYAHWTARTCTVTVTFDARGGTTPSPITVTSGSAYGTLPTTSRTGYTFEGWFTAASGGTQVTPSTIVTATSNHTLYAHWTAETCALTYSGGPNGRIEGELEQTVEYGEDGTAVEAVPDATYRFEQWSDGSTENPRTDTDVTADISVTASFVLDVGELQVTIEPQGAIDDGAMWRRVASVTVKSGTELTSGNVFGVGTPVLNGNVLEVPLLLFRGDDVTSQDTFTKDGLFAGGPAPAVFGFDVVYDPSVLYFSNGQTGDGQEGVMCSDNLTTWYGHEVVVSEPDGVNAGRVRMVFVDSASGGPVTTRDDVRAGGNPGDGENPFLLATMYFECALDADMSTPLVIENLLATDGEQLLEAVAESAEFKLDTGSGWLASGAIETDIAPGTYTVEFKDVVGWTTPDAQEVEVIAGETATATGTYVEIPSGWLLVTITPQAAVDAGAQWRRVGTEEWFDSGSTEEDVPEGSHELEFKTLAGWNAPANQTVTVTAGETLTASGVYTEVVPTGSLQVILTPEVTTTAGIRWRVDGGAWRLSGAVVSNLTIGTHEVSFNDVDAWAQPPSREVTIEEGQTTILTVACEQDGSCSSPTKRLTAEVFEETLPLSLAASPNGTVAPTAKLAVRLNTGQIIDPATVWAVVQSETYYSEQVVWTAVGESLSDGWVVHEPAETLPQGEIITVTVGALTIENRELEPVTVEFLVGEGTGLEEPGEVAVFEDAGIESLPKILATAASPVYRIGPSGVFDEPQTIQIPVPEGTDANSLEIYYFSESQLHYGWYRGENVVGWLVPGSRHTVVEDGVPYIEIQVNHAGLVQLGKPGEVELAGMTLELGASGTRGSWVGLMATLVGLSSLLVVLAATRNKA